MTVVNPKSISGINSITMASGSDDLLTIHSNNTTERVRVNNSGDVIVGSGVTVSPDGDIFATGVTTATTFVGALTGNVTGNISGGTVAGSTGTFTGNVAVSGANITLQDSTGSTDDQLQFGAGSDLRIFHNGTNNYIDVAGDGYLYVRPKTNYYLQNYTSGEVYISGIADGAVNLYYNGTKKFETSDDGASLTGDYTVIGGWPKINLQATQASGENYQIAGAISGVSNQGFSIRNTTDGANVIEIDQDSNRNLKVVSGNVVIGTSGKGIDFSATGGPTSGSGSSELLDDYEEGTFTPTFAFSNDTFNGSYSTQEGHYTKIGNVCHVSLQLVANKGTATSGTATIYNLPFNAKGADNARSSGSVGYYEGFSVDDPIMILVEQSDNKFPLRHSPGTQTTNIANSNVSQTFRIYITVTYFTN